MGDRHHGTSRAVRFGGFEVDLRTGELSRQGRRIHLHDKPFQILVSLLEQAGDLVTREELRERLWSDTIVDFDNNLNAAVSRLREALNDSAQGPRFIETIPRRGYRFVGPPPVWDDKLEPSPGPSGRRFTAVGLAAALAVVAAAALIIVPHLDVQQTTPTTPVSRNMLAVLPFENLSQDPDQEYLANGMTEELLTQLGGVMPARLGVIARTSVHRYRNTEKTIEEIGGELGVDFVVEGSVRVQGERLRIAVQLIRVSDQTHMWADSYDRDARDSLEIQNDVAVRVATAILPKLLLPDAEPAVEGPTENVEAFEEYIQGLWDLRGHDVEGSRLAEQHFHNAVALDPGYARAWAALAEARNYAWYGAKSAEEARQISEQSRAAASRALDIDPSLTEAYVALAFARLYHDWDARGAAEALDPPLASSSNSAVGLGLAAAAFSALARHDEALGAAAEVILLDPASPSSWSALGWTYLFAGRPVDAEASCLRALERYPEHLGAGECLYQALLSSGKTSEAVRVLRQSLIRRGVAGERLESLDVEEPARAVGELERIRLEQILAGDEDDPAAPFNAAAAFARLGEADRAFAGLEMAIERRDSRLLFIGVDPRFDPLRKDPRFDDLLRKVAAPD